MVSTAPINGWLNERTFRSGSNITADGRYRYELVLVNLWQRNSRARLYVFDLETEENIVIPVPFSTNEIIVFFHRSRRQPLIIMQATDNPRQFIARTTESLILGFSETFTIDLDSRTAVKLYRENIYRSNFVRVYADEDLSPSFTVSARLVDTYQGGARIRTQVYLRAIEHSGERRARTWLFTIPIDSALLENHPLRGSWVGQPRWINAEFAGQHGQAFVQTTEFLTGEYRYTFLVDIRQGTMRFYERKMRTRDIGNDTSIGTAE